MKKPCDLRGLDPTVSYSAKTALINPNGPEMAHSHENPYNLRIAYSDESCQGF